MKRRQVIVERVNIVHTYQIEDPFGEPDIDGRYDYHCVEDALFAVDGVISVIPPCPAYGGWTVEVEIERKDEVLLIQALGRAVSDNRHPPKIGSPRSIYLVHH